MSTPSLWPLPADGVRFVVPGFIAGFMARHPLTRGCFPLAMGYYPRARGHKMRRSEHDDHLLIYCLEGAGEVRTQALSSAIGAGDLLLLPKGVGHAYWADRDDPWTIYWCHFSGGVSDDFIALMADLRSARVLPIGHSSAVLAGFKSMFGVRKTGYSATVLIHSANQLRQLLALLPLEIQAHHTRREHGVNIDKIQSLMWDNIAGQLRLEELAAAANLSKYHFSVQYKKLTGYSPIKHFIHMKMEHACFLLDASALSIGEIAAELGYDDALYFSRLFRQTLGVSPTRYRLVH